MQFYSKKWLPLVLGVGISLCHCGSKSVQSPINNVDTTTAVIEWESGYRVVSDPEDPDYHGYARVIALRDGRLLLTYFDSGKETNGGIMARFSSDNGNTWSAPEVIHHNTPHHSVDNPEAFELSDGTLMILTNLRPYVTGGAHHFQIGLMRRPVNGRWSAIEVLYTADNLFQNGCWEPKMVELPDGSLEIYFSDENNFRESNDQEIAKLFSVDKGVSWQGPVRYSYSPGARDGMPVSILLDTTEPRLLTAIEDNSRGGRFTISILEGPVIAGSAATNRTIAVVPDEMIDPSVYCGAPYLAVLPNGGLLLTGQTSYQRPAREDPLHVSVPFIAICEPGSYRKFRLLDANPFRIAPNHEGLWNSVAVVNTDQVLLMTSTQGEDGRFKVCLKKGKFREGQ